MLSILRMQSKQLEKELLETRQQLEPLKRAAKEHDAIVTTKDSRIAELEAELAKMRPLDEVVLCRACGRSADDEPEPPDPEPEPPLVTADVLSKLEELMKRLSKTESKLTSTELAKELAELQLITKTSKLRRDFNRDLENVKTAAKAHAAQAATDIEAAKTACLATNRKLPAHPPRRPHMATPWLASRCSGPASCRGRGRISRD